MCFKPRSRRNRSSSPDAPKVQPATPGSPISSNVSPPLKSKKRLSFMLSRLSRQPAPTVPFSVPEDAGPQDAEYCENVRPFLAKPKQPGTFRPPEARPPANGPAKASDTMRVALAANQWITMTITASAPMSSPSGNTWVSMTTPPTTLIACPRPQEQVQRLEAALDHMHKTGLKLNNRWTVLSSAQRRVGGQGVVQFIRDDEEHVEYVCKFFFCSATFQRESMLYLQRDMREIMAAIVHLAPPGTPCPVMGSLPAWIVLERGSSLTDWAAVAEPDMMTSAMVLYQILQRLATLHSRGLVHRDIKPGNILWRDRTKSWTLIDFGCVAAHGVHASLSFSLQYAAPEVVHAYESGHSTMEARESLDMWSMGVVMYELFTKERAFPRNLDTQEVQDRITGRRLLPWEEVAQSKLSKLGLFRSLVLSCLVRDPRERPSAQNLIDRLERGFHAI